MSLEAYQDSFLRLRSQIDYKVSCGAPYVEQTMAVTGEPSCRFIFIEGRLNVFAQGEHFFHVEGGKLRSFSDTTFLERFAFFCVSRVAHFRTQLPSLSWVITMRGDREKFAAVIKTANREVDRVTSALQVQAETLYGRCKVLTFYPIDSVSSLEQFKQASDTLKDVLPRLEFMRQTILASITAMQTPPPDVVSMVNDQGMQALRAVEAEILSVIKKCQAYEVDLKAHLSSREGDFVQELQGEEKLVKGEAVIIWNTLVDFERLILATPNLNVFSVKKWLRLLRGIRATEEGLDRYEQLIKTDKQRLDEIKLFCGADFERYSLLFTHNYNYSIKLCEQIFEDIKVLRKKVALIKNSLGSVDVDRGLPQIYERLSDVLAQAEILCDYPLVCDASTPSLHFMARARFVLKDLLFCDQNIMAYLPTLRKIKVAHDEYKVNFPHDCVCISEIVDGLYSRIDNVRRRMDETVVGIQRKAEGTDILDRVGLELHRVVSDINLVDAKRSEIIAKLQEIAESRVWNYQGLCELVAQHDQALRDVIRFYDDMGRGVEAISIIKERFKGVFALSHTVLLACRVQEKFCAMNTWTVRNMDPNMVQVLYGVFDATLLELENCMLRIDLSKDDLEDVAERLSPVLFFRSYIARHDSSLQDWCSKVMGLQYRVKVLLSSFDRDFEQLLRGLDQAPVIAEDGEVEDVGVQTSPPAGAAVEGLDSEEKVVAQEELDSEDEVDAEGEVDAQEELDSEDEVDAEEESDDEGVCVPEDARSEMELSPKDEWDSEELDEKKVESRAEEDLVADFEGVEDVENQAEEMEGLEERVDVEERSGEEEGAAASEVKGVEEQGDAVMLANEDGVLEPEVEMPEEMGFGGLNTIALVGITLPDVPEMQEYEDGFLDIDRSLLVSDLEVNAEKRLAALASEEL